MERDGRWRAPVPWPRRQAPAKRARRMLRERLRAGQWCWCLPVRRSSGVWPSCSLGAPRAPARCACRLPPVAGGSVGARRCPGRPSLLGLYSFWTCCCFRTQRATLRRGARRPDVWTAFALMILFFEGRTPARPELLGSHPTDCPYPPAPQTSAHRAAARDRRLKAKDASRTAVCPSRNLPIDAALRGDPTQTGAPEAPGRPGGGPAVLATRALLKR
jgi:hypothetical protein